MTAIVAVGALVLHRIPQRENVVITQTHVLVLGLLEVLKTDGRKTTVTWETNVAQGLARILVLRRDIATSDVNVDPVRVLEGAAVQGDSCKSMNNPIGEGYSTETHP